MNQTAIWDGQRYTLVEQVPSLAGSVIVICQNAGGKRFSCPLDLWLSHAEVEMGTPLSVAAVTFKSTSQEKIALFRSLFRGREDVYAKRWQNAKTGQSGYSPACKNEWAQGMCDKKATPCSRCGHRELLPLTDRAIYVHLEGKDATSRDVVGVYPLHPDDSTYFLAADFDDDGWQEDIAAFRDICRAYGIEPAIERSRSGAGGHAWLFFNVPVPAADARRLGSTLLTLAMEQRAAIALKSYDRLFPNQDFMPKGGFGNLIALPLQGKARREGNSVFLDDAFYPHKDQWAFLASMKKITLKQLDEILGKICTVGELGELADCETLGGKPWERAKLTQLTPLDFPTTARLTLSDGVYLEKEGLSQQALNKIKRIAAFRNPDFYKAQAMRLPTYNKPRIIDTSQNFEQYLKIPRGCLEELLALLPAHMIDDKRNEGRTIGVSFQGSLRAEQLPAAEAMLAEDTGVLSATTAFGKTVLGAYLIGARSVNTLILVHSTALLAQWKKALEQFLTINEALPAPPVKRGRKKARSLIGQLGGGKNELNGIVDIAIMQSLMDGDEVKGLVREYGMVICDECHHVPAVSFEKVLDSTTAKYVYGLTATPLRSDGHQPIIFMQCGKIRYRVDARQQAEQRDFDHFITPRFTPLRLPETSELTIQEVYGQVVKSGTRNQMIVKDVVEALKDRHSPLILTERKEHATTLAGMLKDACQNVFLLIGGEGQKAKREKLETLAAVPPEESLVVVATGKYVGEGFDLPRLDTLYLAMPIAWKGTLAQYAGRLHRNFTGKREVRVYDYVDIHVKVLERMYQKRLRSYGELGYQVKVDEGNLQPGVIFDHRSFYTPFSEDLSNATNHILLLSPFMRKARVTQILKLLVPALQKGIKVTVLTRPPQDYKFEQQEEIASLIEKLQVANITVEARSKIHQKYAVIDQEIVWYGSINFLSFGVSEESVMRFESTDIAGELLDEARKQRI